MKKILVTGGLGYLGGRLAQQLRENGERVLIGTSRADAKLPEELYGIDLVHTDFAGSQSLSSAVDGVKTVFHLASPNEVISGSEPLVAIEGTIAATQRLLEACTDASVSKFIYLSTAHVYGAPLVGRIDESCVTAPRHPYAITHRAAEDLTLMFASRGKLDARVIRLSNAFGPPAHGSVDRWTLLVNDLCRQAVETKKLVLRSDGLDERDFVPISSAVDGIIHLGEVTLPRNDVRIFNVGAGKSARVIDVAKRVQALAHEFLSESVELVVPESVRAEPPMSLEFNVERLQSTGFVSRSELDFEIAEMLKFCASNRAT